MQCLFGQHPDMGRVADIIAGSCPGGASARSRLHDLSTALRCWFKRQPHGCPWPPWPEVRAERTVSTRARGDVRAAAHQLQMAVDALREPTVVDLRPGVRLHQRERLRHQPDAGLQQTLWSRRAPTTPPPDGPSPRVRCEGTASGIGGGGAPRPRRAAGNGFRALVMHACARCPPG